MIATFLNFMTGLFGIIEESYKKNSSIGNDCVGWYIEPFGAHGELYIQLINN
jgi:hypothetical protein